MIYDFIVGLPGLSRLVCLLINFYHTPWLVVHFYPMRMNSRGFSDKGGSDLSVHLLWIGNDFESQNPGTNLGIAKIRAANARECAYWRWQWLAIH